MADGNRENGDLTMDLCITWRIEKELVVFKIELLIDVDATLIRFIRYHALRGASKGRQTSAGAAADNEATK